MGRKIFPILVIALVFSIIGVFSYWGILRLQSTNTISPVTMVKERPLDGYTINVLRQRTLEGSDIVFDEVIKSHEDYTKQVFHFISDGKKVTGLAHIPVTKTPGTTFPVIVQFRGYVPKEIFAPGVGTEHSAEVYAANGYISLAPDFLGYGESDKPGTNTAFEERFETYTTALNLLASVKSLKQWDGKNIFIQAHSNGGQIALTVATILGGIGYPTTLWAPVTKPFPYNVLYYTDESDDLGKSLRKELATLERDYNVDLYSFTNYLDRIKIPIQIHQGTADEAIPVTWSTDIVAKLKKEGVSVQYYLYDGMDHNMSGGWDTVMARDLQFFKLHLK